MRKQRPRAAPRTQLARIRVQSGLQQKDVAQALGIDSSIVSLWELGKRAIPRSRIDAVCGLLGCTPDDLMASIPPPVPDEDDLMLHRWEVIQRARAEVEVVIYWRGRTARVSKTQERLIDAGMMSLPDRPRPYYEVYCLLCARGTGQWGVLESVRKVPTYLPPCRFCGGMMFVRELTIQPMGIAPHGRESALLEVA